MSIRAKYILFVSLLHIVLTWMLYLLLKDRIYLFIASELLIIASLFVSVKLYQALIYPLILMKSGIDAIKDEDFNVKFLKTGSKDMDELIYVFNVMLERLRTERVRTEEQAYFLENLIEILPIGIIIMDYDDQIDTINPAARAFLNNTNIATGDLGQINHPLISTLQDLATGETRVTTVDGTKKFKCHLSQVFHKGFYRKFIMVEELTNELLKTEKEAYGRVIRMMAHEVNNSMGAINSILQTVITYGFAASEGDDMKDSLSLAHERNEALGIFVRRFADLIKLPQPKLTNIDLVPLVDRCMGLDVYDRKGRAISSRLDTAQEHVWIQGDNVLLEQAITNALKNAKESIDNHGEIIVHLQAHAPQLIIADNGPGIHPEDAKRLFSPFYSTKPQGQGIGLMVIREVLNGHGASYTLKTETDGWTRLRVSFPDQAL